MSGDVLLLTWIVTGTSNDGGVFENVYHYVVEVGDERVQRIEMFDAHDLDHARALFEERSR